MKTSGHIKLSDIDVEVMSIDRRWRDWRQASVLLSTSEGEVRVAVGDSVSFEVSLTVRDMENGTWKREGGNE